MTFERRIAVIFGLAILVSYGVLDRAVSSFAHDVLHRPAPFIWLTWIADVPVPASVILLVIAGLGYLAGWRPGRWGRVALAACIATLAATQLKDGLKFAFGRPWPETWVNNNPSWITGHVFGFYPFHGGAGYASFPSGHTTVISAPCAALWQHAGPWRPVLIALPALTALGLLGCDYHFLSDCVAGAALGLAAGTAMDRLIGRI